MKDPWQFLFLTRGLCLASPAPYLQKKINSLFQTFAFTIQHPNTHLWHVSPFEWHLLILNFLLWCYINHLSAIWGNGRWINQVNTWLLWEVHKLCRHNKTKKESIDGSVYWKVYESEGKQDLGQPGKNTVSQTLLAHVRQAQHPTSYFLQPGSFVLGQEELTNTPDQWSIHLEIMSAFLIFWLNRFFMTAT